MTSWYFILELIEAFKEIGWVFSNFIIKLPRRVHNILKFIAYLCSQIVLLIFYFLIIGGAIWTLLWIAGVEMSPKTDNSKKNQKNTSYHGAVNPKPL